VVTQGDFEVVKDVVLCASLQTCVEGMRGVTQRPFQSPIGSDERRRASGMAEFNANQSVKSQ
jgi:hypothetical protein